MTEVLELEAAATALLEALRYEAQTYELWIDSNTEKAYDRLADLLGFDAWSTYG